MHHEMALRLAVKAQNADGASPVSWGGRWKNQMESTMELTVDGNDVTGIYTSKTSAIGAGDEVTSKNLKGYVAGDRISLTVLWPGGSITAWTGQMINDDTTPKIITLWHLVTDVQDVDEPTQLWKSTFAGSDVFYR